MTATRPDISIAVNLLSRYAKSPCVAHFRLGKQIARYLYQTQQWQLKYIPLPTVYPIIAYCDTNYVRSGYSTIGFVIYLGKNVYKLGSKRLKRIVNSTAMAEINGIFRTSIEVYSFIQTLKELGIKYETPKTFGDNKASIQVVT